ARLVGEQTTCLQLQERGEQHEELAARVEIELVPFCEPLDEGHHDRGHVDLGGIELLLEQQRQEKVERPFEGVEVQLEIVQAGRHASDPSVRAGHAPSARSSRPAGQHEERDGGTGAAASVSIAAFELQSAAYGETR